MVLIAIAGCRRVSWPAPRGTRAAVARTKVMMITAALPAGCGGGAEEPTRSDVERAVVEQTGAVALSCEKKRERVWYCWQGERRDIAPTIVDVSEDGKVALR